MNIGFLYSVVISPLPPIKYYFRWVGMEEDHLNSILLEIIYAGPFLIFVPTESMADCFEKMVPQGILISFLSSTVKFLSLCMEGVDVCKQLKCIFIFFCVIED